jgi:hypothetical protein
MTGLLSGMWEGCVNQFFMMWGKGVKLREKKPTAEICLRFETGYGKNNLQ